jgi:hypothetical protein
MPNDGSSRLLCRCQQKNPTDAQSQDETMLLKGDYIVMSVNSCNYRGPLIATMLTCVLFIGDYATAKPVRTDRANEPARLIIRRPPDLGNNVFVSVYLDGKPFTSIGYGHTFEGTLPPGKHVLAVRATPSPKYVIKRKITLNAQSGRTYTFIAKDDGTGSLTLLPEK